MGEPQVACLYRHLSLRGRAAPPIAPPQGEWFNTGLELARPDTSLLLALRATAGFVFGLSRLS
ncbi:hypothetical protein SAMD00023353_5300120 [Rosellinia necatrix]|uniref:Uncharacterized protein n=1 Tax=Rosellinia necatrix TaxID=77044 RepID=A0A1S8AA21_ROSNE|nr:hypothetical protein SAMD00023353_5300120 [Rosellinia necatrix]